MLKKRLGLAAVLLLCLTLAFLFLDRPMVAYHNHTLRRAAASVPDGARVTLGELVPFDWDRVYTFDPYTSRERMEEILGFSSSALRETVSEGMTQLVFVKDGRVTASVCGYPDRLGYQIVFDGFLSRGDEALFTVSETSGTGVRLFRLSAAE